jgi:lysozyme family protein
VTPAAIEKVIEGILTREGEGDASKGYLAKGDRGGRTTWGISEKAHPEAWANGKVPTRESAASIYRREYVKPWEWVESDAIAEQLIDCEVLHGHVTAAKLLQRTLGIVDDGQVGLNTQRALNALPVVYRHVNNALVAWRLKFIDDLTDRDASQKVNKNGWENRALSFLRA